jgi:flagellar biosynthesis protein FliQ
MTEQTVIDLGLNAIWISTLIAAPALIAILITGLVVSILQAATQINEQTLSFIPKILVMTLALAVTGPWILETVTHYTIGIFNKIPEIAR